VITKRVVVTVEKEVIVELPDWMATPQFIADWNTGLWKIDGVDDIIEHAAEMAAQHGDGAFDGLGNLSERSEYRDKEGDVFYRITSHDVESEVQQ